MGKDLPDFFNSLISSFLFNINPATGEKYTIKEFRTPIFVKTAMDLLTTSVNPPTPITLAKNIIGKCNSQLCAESLVACGLLDSII